MSPRLMRFLHVTNICANAWALALGAGGHASLVFIAASAVMLALVPREYY